MKIVLNSLWELWYINIQNFWKFTVFQSLSLHLCVLFLSTLGLKYNNLSDYLPPPPFTISYEFFFGVQMLFLNIYWNCYSSVLCWFSLILYLMLIFRGNISDLEPVYTFRGHKYVETLFYLSLSELTQNDLFCENFCKLIWFQKLFLTTNIMTNCLRYCIPKMTVRNITN